MILMDRESNFVVLINVYSLKPDVKKLRRNLVNRPNWSQLHWVFFKERKNICQGAI